LAVAGVSRVMRRLVATMTPAAAMSGPIPAAAVAILPLVVLIKLCLCWPVTRLAVVAMALVAMAEAALCQQRLQHASAAGPRSLVVVPVVSSQSGLVVPTLLQLLSPGRSTVPWWESAVLAVMLLTRGLPGCTKCL
jgi:hypothetical protein